jgi:hypothetical protein
MRVTIGSRPRAFGCRISPVRIRDLNTGRAAHSRRSWRRLLAQRGCVTAGAIAQAEFTRGNRELRERRPVFDERELLVGYADYNGSRSGRIERSAKDDGTKVSRANQTEKLYNSSSKLAACPTCLRELFTRRFFQRRSRAPAASA